VAGGAKALCNRPHLLPSSSMSFLEPAIAPSRRRNVWWEFSARLLSQQPVFGRSVIPITFIAIRKDRRHSVMIECDRPKRLIARLRNFSAAPRSRRSGPRLSFQAPKPWRPADAALAMKSATPALMSERARISVAVAMAPTKPSVCQCPGAGAGGSVSGSRCGHGLT
jgi:hypothetical protein